MSTFDRYEFTLKKLFCYVMATIILALFGAVYENFSFQVLSFYMIYAFVIPLALGILPLVLMLDSQCRHRYKWLLLEPGASMFWAFGISTLSVGCLITGALEIYGTTNMLTKVYWVAGALFLIIALCINFFIKRKRGAIEREHQV